MEPSVTLVTGTSRGLGRALAEDLLAEGKVVAGCSRGESDLTHPAYRHFVCDVGDESAVVTMVRRIERDFGPIEGLVNNAGIAAMNALLLTPSASARRILETNILGTFHLLREVGKAMARRRNGRIVNLSSIAVPLDLEGEAVYAASKAAIESLTRTAARELGTSGITVNAVGPTAIDTSLTRTVPRNKLEELRRRQAVPREGTPADVSHAVRFFLDPRSDFISGQILYLGGIGG